MQELHKLASTASPDTSPSISYQRDDPRRRHVLCAKRIYTANAWRWCEDKCEIDMKRAKANNESI